MWTNRSVLYKNGFFQLQPMAGWMKWISIHRALLSSSSCTRVPLSFIFSLHHLGGKMSLTHTCSPTMWTKAAGRLLPEAPESPELTLMAVRRWPCDLRSAQQTHFLRMWCSREGVCTWQRHDQAGTVCVVGACIGVPPTKTFLLAGSRLYSAQLCCFSPILCTSLIPCMFKTVLNWSLLCWKRQQQ